MRRPLLIANWKMNLSLGQAQGLARELVRRLSAVYAGPEVVICPSHPHLAAVAELLEGSILRCGAQDVVAQAPGAVTGGVSAEQLRELGIRWVLVGHSERRKLFGENDEDVAGKLRAAFRVGLAPVLCFGETREEREAGRTEERVLAQLSGAVDGLEPVQLAALVLAYEPVWAIGSGLNAALPDAEAVHRLARGFLAERGGAELAASVRILYGGSVKVANAGDYLGSPEIDGALVGGASLDAESFAEMVCWRVG